MLNKREPRAHYRSPSSSTTHTQFMTNIPKVVYLVSKTATKLTPFSQRISEMPMAYKHYLVSQCCSYCFLPSWWNKVFLTRVFPLKNFTFSTSQNSDIYTLPICPTQYFSEFFFNLVCCYHCKIKFERNV